VKAITSSTFNFEEAEAASSDADFLAKMRIALREVKEARVAIRLIVACELAGYEVVGGYEDEAPADRAHLRENHRNQEGEHGTSRSFLILNFEFLIYCSRRPVSPNDGPDDKAKQDEGNRRYE
jgi:23S rRNA-intervening sequence protein